MDRHELADFLRSRRELLRPDDVGLPAGFRRRTPGLRREEVAQLAHISTDYYTRLEQARGRHPSRTVLAGIARALRLSDEERGYLFDLAGQPQQQPAGPPTEVPPSLLTLLDRMPERNILDMLANVSSWTQCFRHLGPLFGSEPKLADPRTPSTFRIGAPEVRSSSREANQR